MLAELSSTLSTYYRSPSFKKRKQKNLILVPIGSNDSEIYQNQNQMITSNKALNNYNKNIPNQYRIQSYAITPSYKYSNLFTPDSYNNEQNINFLCNKPNLSSDIILNNYKNLDLRPKSAMKARKNKKTKNSRIPINNNNYSFDINNNYKVNTSKIRRNNNKLMNIQNNDNINYDFDDYDINYNMNNFQNIIGAINRNGFQRYQDEINDKKILVAQLENSIAVLKNKICLCKSNLYDGLHKESKNKIKYENMLSVSNRYKNIGKTADSYKNEINNFQNKIADLNNETLKLKTLGFNIQNDIDLMNEEIRKGNKAISDKQKEIENILPALQLLKNHITSVKQKIFKYNNAKQNYLGELTYIENSI